jgi:hypothetical protein
VRTLGVKGDGQTDDTAALQKAATTHDVLYFPIGNYIVRDTITLGPNTQVIALHPGLTQLDLPDNTPAYQGVGAPKAVLLAPSGGTNIVSALGIFTGNVNPRATGLLWMAGETSLVDDVQFHGGAGGYLTPAVRAAFYSGGRGTGPGGAAPAAGAAPSSTRAGAQYPSLWVTRGGGGTFTAIWSPAEAAQSGVYVSDTTTPGHVYQLSNEHHLINEIKIERVENWEFFAPQTEEEASASPEAVSLEIVDSKNITIANYHAYRVTRSQAAHPSAARVYNSSDIRFRNVHVNAESGYGTSDENGPGTFLRVSKFPYDHAVQNITHGTNVREREFAMFDIVAPSPAPKSADASAIVATGAKLEKLADGFHAISGAAVDASGTLYFVDKRQHRIYAWSAARGLTIVRNDPLDPVNLAVDRSGALLVVSSSGPQGTVYSFKPGSPAGEMTILEPKPVAPLVGTAGAAFVLPVNVWNNGEFANQLNLETMRYTTLAEMLARDVGARKDKAYVSPDGSLVLPAVRVFRQGQDGSYPGIDTSGWRWSNNLSAFGLMTARPGQRVYVVSSAENRTYRATVNTDGTLGELVPFAERGGESVTVDEAGNVYVTNGQVFVYNPAGTLIAEIEVPERPVQVLFGGPDRRTLFVLAHHTLYAVKRR